MLKFPPELIVHRGNVFSLLCAVGGLVVTVAAGGRCVDVAVRTAQDPANLLRLSHALIGLMGLRYQIHTNSAVRRKVKRLYFTESFDSFLDVTRTTRPGTSDVQVFFWFPTSLETNPESTSANCVSVRRCRVYYILICGVGSQPILTLRVGNNGSKLNAYCALNKLQWLVNFSSRAQARGDVIFLLHGEESGQTSAGSDANKATSLTLGLSVLSVVLLWMFLPYIAVCAVICFGWEARKHPHKVLLSQKRS